MPVNPAFDPADYPDDRSDEVRKAERKHVVTQVASLQRMASSSFYQREAFAKLDGRRRPHAGRVQLEEVRRADRPDLMVAQDSVVARGRGGAARLDIERHKGSLRKAILRLRSAKVDAEVNYAIPLAGHIKGAGGPEPTALSRPFPAIDLPESPASLIVAVLDTGISEEARADGYLAMAVAAQDVDRLDEFPPDGLLDAGAGHGAFVAGIIQQVAPNARIQIHKVVDSDGITTDTELADGLRAAAAAGAKIINMSMGSETEDDQAPPAILDAVRELQAAGVLLVCAAGNNAGDNPVWPAALAAEFDNVVAVAALAPDTTPATWSSRGDWVTCSTIGEGVVSTYVKGTEDGPLIGDPDPDTYGDSSWACWTGTSFATPQITGALVRLMSENPQLATPQDALQALEKLATPSSGNGYGWSVQILPGT